MATAMNAGTWAYAVPMDSTNGHEQPQLAGTERAQESHHTGFRELRSGSLRRTSDVMSDSETVGTRRASIRSSNASTSRKRSRNQLREKRPEIAEGPVDDSAWIHRDKLAQIEIQEMAEAGIHVRSSRRSLSAGPGASARSSSSMSRSGGRRPSSKDRRESGEHEQYGTAHTTYDDFERKRVSTIPAADEEDLDWDPSRDAEIRTPEEIAAQQQSYRQPTIRPSTSRIPISKASPVPVPQTVVDRDSPLPRSRQGSSATNGAWDDSQYARRARSASGGSAVLLDEADGVNTPPRPSSSHLNTSDENSPPKPRVPSKPTPVFSTRKTSLAANAAKQLPAAPETNGRTTSPTIKRPPSSAGHKSRPSTSHAAPMGEAPWVASMYKPDPRLPPDQQMLPTHAKRMMQEQWERDGKTGTAYDRELNLLNDNDFHKPKSPPPLNPNRTTLDYQQSNNTRFSPTKPQPTERPVPAPKPAEAWPLSPTKSDTKSEAGSPRPGTSGGYKITPTISTPPAIQLPSTMQQILPPTPALLKPTPRVPDLDEKQEAQPRKGCCCVVM